MFENVNIISQWNLRTILFACDYDYSHYDKLPWSHTHTHKQQNVVVVSK